MLAFFLLTSITLKTGKVLFFSSPLPLPIYSLLFLFVFFSFFSLSFLFSRYESTFGVNHLAHFLLTQLLIEHLEHPARIIFIGSATHDPAKKTGAPIPVYTSARELAIPPHQEDKEEEKEDSKAGQRRYSTSKLCNVLCAYEMVRRLKEEEGGEVPRVSVGVFEPGLMPGTGLARDHGAVLKFAWNYIFPIVILFMSNAHTAATSGASLARLVADEGVGIHNKYFEGRKEIPSSEESYDEEKAKDLWETSLELVGLVTKE